MADTVTFSTNATERRAGRFTIDSKRSAPCRTEDGFVTERVSYGADKDGPAVVWESGRSQVGMPTYAVATAVACGKVIPMSALASALIETGQVQALTRELDKLAKAAAK